MKKFLSIVLTITLLMSTFVGASCFAAEEITADSLTQTHDDVQAIYGTQNENQPKEKSSESNVKFYSVLAGAAAIALGTAGFLLKKFLLPQISNEGSVIENPENNGPESDQPDNTDMVKVTESVTSNNTDTIGPESEELRTPSVVKDLLKHGKENDEMKVIAGLVFTITTIISCAYFIILPNII